MTCDTYLYGVQQIFCVLDDLLFFQMQVLFQYLLQELQYNKQKKNASLM